MNGISRRFASEAQRSRNGPHIGIELRERGHTVLAEVSGEALQEATRDTLAREALRVRLKARRDRMLFKPRPAAISKHITPVSDPGFSRFGGGGGRGRGRR